MAVRAMKIHVHVRLRVAGGNLLYDLSGHLARQLDRGQRTPMMLRFDYAPLEEPGAASTSVKTSTGCEVQASRRPATHAVIARNHFAFECHWAFNPVIRHSSEPRGRK